MGNSLQQRGSIALTVMLLLSMFVARSAGAQTFQVLYSFTGQPGGYEPSGGLLRDAAGNLFGTTALGGSVGCSYYGQEVGCGTVFEVRSIGGETVLYSFAGSPDGSSPEASLVRDSQGNFYGTTEYGGDDSCNWGCGVVFKIDTAGQETVVYRFNNSPDGANPYDGLFIDGDILYGTTMLGGAYNEGSVFEVTTSGQERVIYSFGGEKGDGATPWGGLVRDRAGNLYGTTVDGGAYSWGTLFKLDPNGKETILHSFKGSPDDGNNPTATLLLASGDLYGVTSGGGQTNSYCGQGCGTVFKVNKRTGNETVLYRFKGPPDGKWPLGRLIMDANGDLYGTTYEGGTFLNKPCQFGGCGIVFKLSKTGKRTVLHSFSGGNDGGYVAAGLVRDVKGRLYGTATNGGYSACDGGCGVVFKIKP